MEPSMIPLLIMDACFSVCCLGLRELLALPTVSFDDTEPLPLWVAKSLNVQYYLTFLMDFSSIFNPAFVSADDVKFNIHFLGLVA